MKKRRPIAIPESLRLVPCKITAPVVYMLLASVFVLANRAGAEHPIDVQRLAAKGDYMKALSTYDSMPERRRTTYSSIAAARSAWALGLTNRAVEEFERVLQDNSVSKVDRGRVLLSRGIIEFQEGRYPTAAVFADRSARELEQPSSLRAKVWLLWGQSLMRMASWAPAEEKALKALEEGSDEDLGEIHYTIGVVQQMLGRNTEARQHFEKVPLEHERTPLAIRNLAEIALEDGRYEDVLFWLDKGRKDYSDNFLDSWVDYTAVEAAIGMDDVEKVRSVRAEAARQFPPSDKWFNLIEAAAEGYEWKRLALQGKEG